LTGSEDGRRTFWTRDRNEDLLEEAETQRGTVNWLVISGDSDGIRLSAEFQPFGAVWCARAAVSDGKPVPVAPLGRGTGDRLTPALC
jgi:hypothetical protein